MANNINAASGSPSRESRTARFGKGVGASDKRGTIQTLRGVTVCLGVEMSYPALDDGTVEVDSMEGNTSQLRVVDLIEAGLLKKYAAIHGLYGDLLVEGVVLPDGTIKSYDIISASPSVAAGQAITALTGRRSPGRNYLSVNGWLFWHTKVNDGATKTLADLRRQLTE